MLPNVKELTTIKCVIINFHNLNHFKGWYVYRYVYSSKMCRAKVGYQVDIDDLFVDPENIILPIYFLKTRHDPKS